MGSRDIDLQCWKCGTELKNLLLPFSRYEECGLCKGDLHVCIACKNYNTAVLESCNEDRADFILEKDKANFCDYFIPNTQAYKRQDNREAKEARAKLAALFGEEPPDAPTNSSELTSQNEADKALAELKRLFGDKD